MTRRNFLGASVAAGLAAPGAGAADEPLPIIATHQHLWDLGKFRLPWVKQGSPPARNHRMADSRKEAEGLNLVKTVSREVDVDPAQQVAEAEFDAFALVVRLWR